jgi:hypothetical protein
LIGLVLGLVGVARGPGRCAIAGFGAMAMFPFESEMADVSLRSGYKLAITLFGAACLLHLQRVWA